MSPRPRTPIIKTVNVNWNYRVTYPVRKGQPETQVHALCRRHTEFQLSHHGANKVQIGRLTKDTCVMCAEDRW